jgi:hypothetical protein
MRLAEIAPRVVCLCHESRFPVAWYNVRDQLRAKGIDPEVFVNGTGLIHGCHLFDNVAAPIGFVASQGSFNILRSFREIIWQARRDRLESVLIVEDDLILTPECDPVLSRIELPDDWELFYAGANHYWHPTEEVGPHLLRLHGSLCTHCVAIRSSVFDLILDLPAIGPVDWLFGVFLHHRGRSYAAWPSVAIQSPGPSLTTGSMEDYTLMFRSKGVNWSG